MLAIDDTLSTVARKCRLTNGHLPEISVPCKSPVRINVTY
jgi:hypothetical protein